MVKLLSSFNKSIGKSFKYLRAEYPAPKSSRAIETPRFLMLDKRSDAKDKLFSSAVSVTSIPKSPFLTPVDSIKSLNTVSYTHLTLPTSV